jgi:hypothetical protein
MNKLILLQPCSVFQATVEAETLREALQLKPAWLRPITRFPHLWIFRGEKWGDESLLETSWFGASLSGTESHYDHISIEMILQYLNDKHTKMRQASHETCDIPR